MYTNQHGKEWAYILADADPRIVAVANTEILDKLCENLDADAWPSSGVILLGDEEPNQLPPEGVEVTMWTQLVSEGRSDSNEGNCRRPVYSFHLDLHFWDNRKSKRCHAHKLEYSVKRTLAHICFVISWRQECGLSFLGAHSFGSTFDLHWMIRMGVRII